MNGTLFCSVISFRVFHVVLTLFPPHPLLNRPSFLIPLLGLRADFLHVLFIYKVLVLSKHPFSQPFSLFPPRRI
ncbi:hypothetical protein BJ322DRAFT_849179 [Thelephora terrestris]|uniref:Uncharacterized protein n=1 Tax=Thelephora terrestris TaxID=56493 RepID=A0A9P6L667_9AGAM|nr:hypothetical protein BJ322DRAFT_849179 [Thelephora terrestris]